MAGATLIALGFRVAGEPLRWRLFGVSLLSLLLYWVAVIAGAELQAAVPLAAGLHWNWLGKIFSVAVVFAAILLLPERTRQEVGIRWRQKDGSLRPAALCIILICTFSWTLEAWNADGVDVSIERLAFQAIMPGLDEELFFRGLFLALLFRAFKENFTILGASIGPAGAIVTFVFAAGHGITVNAGAIHFDAIAFFTTGTIGAGLLWIRQRTGSILLAIVAHNLVNLGNSFW
jgi:membrane protease YdiL (CAAX protease family)